MQSMQLNKYLAHAGVCSRRDAVNLILDGMVSVNGVTIVEPGHRVIPRDMVLAKGRVIKPESKIYVLLNKPRGYVTTLADERGRKTVMDLIPGAVKQRLYPIGRLDRDTTGVLLLTNDGELSQKLAHPRNGVTKIYQVALDKPLEHAHLVQIREGLQLFDGRIKVDSASYLPGKTKHNVKVELHSGKNRIVRRIFEHLGYKVRKLDRINYAGLTRRNVIPGGCRTLTADEVSQLKEHGFVSKQTDVAARD